MNTEPSTENDPDQPTREIAEAMNEQIEGEQQAPREVSEAARAQMAAQIARGE